LDHESGGSSIPAAQALDLSDPVPGMALIRTRTAIA
jgi:hypothetical protein